MYSIQQLDWSMKNSQIPINFEVRCIGFTTDRDIHRDSPGKLNTLDLGMYFNYFNTRNTSSPNKYHFFNTDALTFR